MSGKSSCLLTRISMLTKHIYLKIYIFHINMREIISLFSERVSRSSISRLRLKSTSVFISFLISCSRHGYSSLRVLFRWTDGRRGGLVSGGLGKSTMNAHGSGGKNCLGLIFASSEREYFAISSTSTKFNGANLAHGSQKVFLFAIMGFPLKFSTRHSIWHCIRCVFFYFETAKVD